MNFLNKQTIKSLPQAFDVLSVSENKEVDNAIVHIGVGGFHRSHQAFALAQLISQDPVKYAKWRITGVGVMPQDKELIANFREQDYLYTLRMVNADGEEKLMVIDAIQDFLHLDCELNKIIKKIASEHTKIVSLTITEGGYNYDFEKDAFKIENENIIHDLNNKQHPKTVFGLLARALEYRMSNTNSSIVLLSCDNIIGNGEILRKSLLSFLEGYDRTLRDWVKTNVFFPNCMVDRITPVPKKNDVEDLTNRFQVKDNCLVVSEDYFQWVIEKGKYLSEFPPLQLVGVEFVDKVLYYEKMKLGILNGGHTLVGLLGYALGYNTIHDAVLDPMISSVYNAYVHEEVIPVLSPISGVDYHEYYEKVKTRFANAMINDSTDRIISFSSDKFPKFILPIYQSQCELHKPKIRYVSIIVAAWWYYLRQNQIENGMSHVQDSLKGEWSIIFDDEDSSALKFIEYNPVFGDMGKNELFLSFYLEAINHFKAGTFKKYLNNLHLTR
ncbi:MAG: mannitol dehydrogenase family protein [Sphingobacterium composti]|uniref:mannitol dehydrogenase family protein n=1 Tax=Sphingobacterium composti TaxID=363260 RepID=UPI001F1E470E|nr:mannitol dehydrogenase family protein [Sphingobacterium composti Ten et al. 2007 non Yoo et al. 2007]